MRFSSAATSVRATRRFVASVLEDDVEDDVVRRVQLAASELATNAIEHAGTPFAVDVALHGDVVRLAVTDGSSRRPVVRQPALADVGGRGLALVVQLSRRWGVDEGVDEKTVWCEIPAPRIHPKWPGTTA